MTARVGVDQFGDRCGRVEADEVGVVAVGDRHVGGCPQRVHVAVVDVEDVARVHDARRQGRLELVKVPHEPLR